MPPSQPPWMLAVSHVPTFRPHPTAGAISIAGLDVTLSKFRLSTEPTSLIPEECLRFRSQSELLGLANTSTQLPWMFLWLRICSDSNTVSFQKRLEAMRAMWQYACCWYPPISSEMTIADDTAEWVFVCLMGWWQNYITSKQMMLAVCCEAATTMDLQVTTQSLLRLKLLEAVSSQHRIREQPRLVISRRPLLRMHLWRWSRRHAWHKLW